MDSVTVWNGTEEVAREEAEHIGLLRTTTEKSHPVLRLCYLSDSRDPLVMATCVYALTDVKEVHREDKAEFVSLLLGY